MLLCVYIYAVRVASGPAWPALVRLCPAVHVVAMCTLTCLSTACMKMGCNKPDRKNAPCDKRERVERQVKLWARMMLLQSWLVGSGSAVSTSHCRAVITSVVVCSACT